MELEVLTIGPQSLLTKPQVLSSLPINYTCVYNLREAPRALACWLGLMAIAYDIGLDG